MRVNQCLASPAPELAPAWQRSWAGPGGGGECCRVAVALARYKQSTVHRQGWARDLQVKDYIQDKLMCSD